MFNSENHKIWEIFLESLLEEAYSVKSLEEISPESVLDDMEQIESRNFSFVYRKDADYLKNDFEFEGFCGVGLFDESNQIKGYVYGYSITDDEYSDLDSILNYNPTIKIYDQRFAELQDTSKLIEWFPELFTPRNTLYIANFAVDRQYRLGVKRMLLELIRLAKRKGFKYFAFDGLSDTAKLLCDERGNIKQDRLLSAGLNLAISCTVGRNDDHHMFAIIELN